MQKGELAIWQKPTNHIHCKMNRKVFKEPGFCHAQDPDTAWYCFLTVTHVHIFEILFSYSLNITKNQNLEGFSVT